MMLPMLWGLQSPRYLKFRGVRSALTKCRQVSGEIDCIHVPNNEKYEQTIKRVKSQAIAKAQLNGAQFRGIEVVELEIIPLQYANNGAVRAIVKAVRNTKFQTIQ